MTESNAIADNWGTGDVFALIVAALQKAGKNLDLLTMEDLAPVDHYHARGFPATVELADRLPVRAEHHLLDIGCGVGGPARYFAKRFGCTVTGIDITLPFVEAANKLSALLRMQSQVHIRHGDGHSLPFADASFDGAFTQHVTMNVADRARFFAEAYRVLKPGGYFALTEHGLGPTGDPYYPLPWSTDGTGAYLVAPADTRRFLQAAGFDDIATEDTGPKYVAAYSAFLAKADAGEVPALGTHIFGTGNGVEKTRNSRRNILEARTHPIQVLCRKPG